MARKVKFKSVKGVKVITMPPDGQPCARCICRDCSFGKQDDFSSCAVFGGVNWPCESCESVSWVEDCGLFKNMWGESWKHPTKKWLKEFNDDIGNMWGL